jgi:hypothetical protein
LKALLSKTNALQLFQAVLLGRAVYHCVSEYNTFYSRVEERCLARTAAMVVDFLSILKVPRVPSLAVKQAWVIVALV